MEEYNKELEKKQLEFEEYRKKPKIFKNPTFVLTVIFIVFGILTIVLNLPKGQEVTMSQSELAAFNNVFLKFGGKQKGAEVESLINDILAFNIDPKYSIYPVTVNNSSQIGIKGIDYTSSYMITFDYKDGRVINVNIEELTQ